MVSLTTANSTQTDRLTREIEKLTRHDRIRFRRLWAYYRNPMRPSQTIGDAKPYRQAQEWGLPSRITGFLSGSDVTAGQQVTGVARKEVVIENDIAWRIDTMVEYLFGKPLVIASAAADPARRDQISDLLRQIVAANGGMIFLQQLALLASVYGFVDVLVKLDLAKLESLRAEAPDVAASHDSTGAGDTQSLGRAPAATAAMTDSTAASAANAQANSTSQGDAAPSHDNQSSDLSPATRPPDASSPTQGSAPNEALASTLASSPVTASADASPASSSATAQAPALAKFARLVRFETIEPARALPLLSPDDYRVIDAYAQVYEQSQPTAADTRFAAPQGGWLDRLYRSTVDRVRTPLFNGISPLAATQIVELLTPDTWQRIENGKLVASGKNSLGQIPLVHIQNLAVPFEYSGASDIEPLIPLQDELNTRLSDRAYRITMQSFKMYLGKGIDNFTEMPVAPGRMWATDNTDAEVDEFGGDSSNPSEESHIGEIREALDKTSGVSPVASGGVKNKLGHLTSAAALRVTMQSLLSRTEKKRITFGLAISRLCELSLAWLDAAGVFHTTPDERLVELHWANPLPLSEEDELDEAQKKLEIGVPRDVVLRELGY